MLEAGGEGRQAILGQVELGEGGNRHTTRRLGMASRAGMTGVRESSSLCEGGSAPLGEVDGGERGVEHGGGLWWRGIHGCGVCGLTGRISKNLIKSVCRR